MNAAANGGAGAGTGSPPLPAPGCSLTSAIIHVDMDCFYAQVERERFPHFRSSPMAVVQNGTLVVTSNYDCRLRGLSKMGSPHAMRSACCSIKFVGSDMKRYRAASKLWYKIFQSFSPDVIVQKKSIDEAYLDVTKLARQRIRQGIFYRWDNQKDQQEMEEINRKRWKAAENTWKTEESKEITGDSAASPSLLPSAGTLEGAIFASKPTDPISQRQELEKQRNPQEGQAATVSAEKFQLPNEMIGKSEEEIHYMIRAIHPIDYCRGNSQENSYGALETIKKEEMQKKSLIKQGWIGNILLETPKSSRLSGTAATVNFLEDSHKETGETEEGEDIENPEGNPQWPQQAPATEKPQKIPQPDSSKSEFPLPYVPEDFHIPPPLDFSHEDPNAPSSDFLLWVASQIAFEIRLALFLSTGFTTSAGIAPNARLAKLASSRNKPNQQTIVRAAITTAFLSTVPFKEITGFGPKAQERLEAVGISLIGQVQGIPNQRLLTIFHGDYSFCEWLNEISIGNDFTLIEPSGPPKSLGQSKRQTTKTFQERRDLLKWLIARLFDRIVEDSQDYHRFPSSFSVSYSNAQWLGSGKRVSIPNILLLSNPLEFLQKHAETLLKELIPPQSSSSSNNPSHHQNPHILCKCLSIGVMNFQPFPQMDGKFSMIEKYFEKGKNNMGNSRDSGDSSGNSGEMIGKTVDNLPSVSSSSVVPASSSSSSLFSFPRSSRPPKRDAVLQSFFGLKEEENPQKQENQKNKQNTIDLTENSAKKAKSSVPSAPSTAASSSSSSSSSPPPSLVPSEPEFLCPICHLSLPESSSLSHSDYHLAEKIQKEIRHQDRQEREKKLQQEQKGGEKNRQGKPGNSMAIGGKGKKISTPAMASGGGQNGLLDRFFQKKSS